MKIIYPVAFSPITDQESDSTDQEDEPHFETNYDFNQSREYVEPYFSESKYNIYQTSTLNGIQLSEQDDQNSNSDNSYAALDDVSLDDVSDSEDSILKREEGEISPTPPKRMPKKKKKQKMSKRLKRALL